MIFVDVSRYLGGWLLCMYYWNGLLFPMPARPGCWSQRGMILCINHCIQCKSNLCIPLLWFVVCVCCVNVVVWMISLMQIYKSLTSVDEKASPQLLNGRKMNKYDSNVTVGSILTHSHSVDLSAHHCSVDCCIPHFFIEHSLLLAQRASVVDCCICIVYCSWLFIIYSSSLPGITLNNSLPLCVILSSSIHREKSDDGTPERYV